MEWIRKQAGHLRDWSHRARSWLNDGGYLWVGLLGLILVPLGVHLAGYLLPLTVTQQVRYAGLGLELLGLYLVARELARAQQAFGGKGDGSPLKAFSGWLTAYLGAFPTWPRNIVVMPITGVGISTGLGAVVGQSAGVVSGKPSIDERVGKLEALQKEDRESIQKIDAALSQHRETTKQMIEQERIEREAADRQHAKTLKELATGGVPAQAMGWVWIFTGSVAGALDTEIAGLLRFLGWAH